MDTKEALATMRQSIRHKIGTQRATATRRRWPLVRVARAMASK